MRLRVAVMVGLGFLTLSRPGLAQTVQGSIPELDWSFSPGARANAMGGAFIATADDATATVTNPAGLLSWMRPQAVVEVRNTTFRTQRFSATNSAKAGAAPTAFSQSVTMPSFMSFARPIGKRTVVGFTRHEFLNYSEPYHYDRQDIDGIDGGIFAENANTNASAVSYAGSVAVAATSKLRLGLTVAINHLVANSSSTAIDSQNRPLDHVSLDDSSTAASFTAGAIYQPRESVSLGLTYSKGASFNVVENYQRVDVNGGPLLQFPGFPLTLPINVPDRLGAGVALQASSNLRVAADVIHVGYSSLEAATLTTGVKGLNDIDLTQGARIDNVTEVHAGAEYAVRRSQFPLFIRAGFLHEPDHNVKLDNTQLPGVLELQRATYRVGDDVTLGTFGVGFGLGRLGQLDVAYTFRRDTVASLALHF